MRVGSALDGPLENVSFPSIQSSMLKCHGYQQTSSSFANSTQKSLRLISPSRKECPSPSSTGISVSRAFSRVSFSRPSRIHDAPSVANLWAIASPIPREPPLMSAFCPESRPLRGFLVWAWRVWKFRWYFSDVTGLIWGGSLGWSCVLVWMYPRPLRCWWGCILIRGMRFLVLPEALSIGIVRARNLIWSLDSGSSGRSCASRKCQDSSPRLPIEVVFTSDMNDQQSSFTIINMDKGKGKAIATAMDGVTHTEDGQSKYVTLISRDGFEFVVLREAALRSGAIRRMLDRDRKQC